VNSLGAAQSANAGAELRKSSRDRLIQLIVISAILLAITVLVFLISIRLSTALIRRLVRLRRETLQLADERLPSIVDRLRVGREGRRRPRGPRR
jgi:hypothetical protein